MNACWVAQLSRDVSGVDVRSVDLQSAFEPELQLISSGEAITAITDDHRPTEQPLAGSQVKLTQHPSQVRPLSPSNKITCFRLQSGEKVGAIFLICSRPYWVVWSRLWHDVLSVCRLSVTFCIVAKRYVVEGRRWYRWIGRW